MKKIMGLFNTLKQPSSWAGMAVLLSAFGVSITGEQWQALVQLGIAIAGAGAIFINEKTAEKAE